MSGRSKPEPFVQENTRVLHIFLSPGCCHHRMAWLCTTGHAHKQRKVSEKGVGVLTAWFPVARGVCIVYIAFSTTTSARVTTGVIWTPSALFWKDGHA
jgi:hypothetical protein